MGLNSRNLDTIDIQPRDHAVEEITSLLTAVYMYATSVHLRYQQLGLSEYYVNRPYHRIAIALLIPITILLGIRHPVIRFLRYAYYFLVYVSHLLQREGRTAEDERASRPA